MRRGEVGQRADRDERPRRRRIKGRLAARISIDTFNFETAQGHWEGIGDSSRERAPNAASNVIDSSLTSVRFDCCGIWVVVGKIQHQGTGCPLGW